MRIIIHNIIILSIAFQTSFFDCSSLFTVIVYSGVVKVLFSSGFQNCSSFITPKTQPQGSYHTKICKIQIRNQVYQIAIKKLVLRNVISGRALNEQVLQALGIWNDLFDFIYGFSWAKSFQLNTYFVESQVFEFCNSLELAKGSLGELIDYVLKFWLKRSHFEVKLEALTRWLECDH